jgi:hypothetical protein
MAKTSQVPRFVRLATAEKVSHFMAENTTQQHGPGETRKAPSQSPWTLLYWLLGTSVHKIAYFTFSFSLFA